MTNSIYINPPPLYVPRTMHGIAWHHDEAYLIGGWDGTKQFSDIWRTKGGDPSGEWGELWFPIPEDPDFGQQQRSRLTRLKRWLGLDSQDSKVARHAAGNDLFSGRSYLLAQSFRGHLHFVGGYNTNYPGFVIKDHWSTGTGGRYLARWQPPPWEAREAYGLAASEDAMVLVGGVTYLDPDSKTHLRAFDDVWTFDHSGKWSLTLNDAPWGKRRSMGWEYLDGYFWLWGGFDSWNNPHSDLWRWDGDSTPEQMETPRWPARAGFFFCAANGRLWTMGGIKSVSGRKQGEMVAEVWSYQPSTNQWFQHDSAPWTGRIGSRALVKPGNPDTIYIVGGMSGAKPNRISHGDVWSTQNGDSWKRHHSSSLDIARPEETAIP